MVKNSNEDGSTYEVTVSGSNANSFGVRSDGGLVTIGGGKTNSISISSATDSKEGSNSAFGVLAQSDSKGLSDAVLNAEKVTVKATGTNNSGSEALASWAFSAETYGDKGTALTVNATDVILESTASGSGSADGMESQDQGSGAKLNINADNLVSVSSNSLGSGSAIGISAAEWADKTATVSVVTKDLEITASTVSGDSIGINSQSSQNKGSPTATGDALVSVQASNNLKITAQTKSGTAKGLYAFGAGNNQGSGQIKMEAGNDVTVQAISTDGEAIGIWAQNNNDSQQATAESDVAGVTITAKSTTITAKGETGATGISAFSGSQVTINGGLNLSATTNDGQLGTAIQTRGNSLVDITGKNADGSAAPVVIGGNVVYDFANTEGSGNVINSQVKMNLSGAQSSWKGNVLYSQGTEGEQEATADNLDFQLSLGDGATWTPTNVAAYGTPSESKEGEMQIPVTTLTMDGGNIDASDYTGPLQVSSYEGEGTFVTNLNKAEDGKYTSGSTLEIDKVTGDNSSIKAEAGNISTGDLASQSAAVEALNALAQSVTVGDATAAKAGLQQTVEITDPYGGPSISAVVNEDGEVTANSVVIENNPVFENLETAVALGTAQWRAQIGSLFKRLGEVRDSEGNIGAWARIYQNRVKWRGEHNDTFTVQIGADYKFADQFIAGGAFNYSKGDTKVSGVNGDNHAWGFALYGTWLGPDGIYVDLEGKYNRLDNKITSSGGTGYMHGKYKANAWSLSAQTGWTLPLSEMFFVEPQAQLSWGQAGSDTFSTGRYEVNQKAFNVVEGRVGAKAGIKFPESRGQAYVKASVLYDWASKFKGSLKTAGIESKFDEKLGGCAGEFAVGGQYNMTKNAHVYADFTTRAGGKLKEPFQWNVGMRFTF